MRRKRPKTLHRAFLALALLGAALHVSAFAWHPYARSWTVLSEWQLLADVQAAICHNIDVANPAESPGDGRAPPAPERKTECLICQGLAHACFAVRATADLVFFAPAAPRLTGPASVAVVGGTSTMPPRSRGPPRWA
jgi:hypothetical protein